jgi:hypothetical protein
VWDLLQQSHKVSELRDAILSEYDIDVARCEQDLFHLLAELADKGLVDVSTEFTD